MYLIHLLRLFLLLVYLFLGLRLRFCFTILGVSDGKAYGIIRQLNKELESRGFHTVTGRVSRQYFEECFYGITGEKEVV